MIKLKDFIALQSNCTGAELNLLYEPKPSQM